jgi:hypothetical protein
MGQTCLPRHAEFHVHPHEFGEVGSSHAIHHGKMVKRNTEDYRCALYTFANQAEALARAFADPIKELTAAQRPLEGRV